MLGLRKSQITKLFRKNRNIVPFLWRLMIIEQYWEDNYKDTNSVFFPITETDKFEICFDDFKECFCKTAKIPQRMMETNTEEYTDEKFKRWVDIFRNDFVNSQLNSTRSGHSKKIYNKLNRKIS